MSESEAAANIQGMGWGLLIGSQAVRIDGVNSAYVLAAAGAVLLTGMLLERREQPTESAERETA